MTQFTVRHDVFESNSSNRTMFVATRALVQSTAIGSETQFRVQRTLQKIFLTVRFETNGGSSIDPIQVELGSKITKPADPAKTDQQFDGWYSDSELTQSWDFNTVVYEDMTLYAKWEDIKLPYDAEIEYLESNRSQIINTTIIPTFNTVAKASYTLLQYTGDTTFGHRGTSDSTDWRYFDFGGGTIFDCGSARIGQQHVLTLNTKYNVEFGTSNNTTYLDIRDANNQQLHYYSTTKSGSISSMPITLFGDVNHPRISCRLYLFQIYENSQLILDLIPVRVEQVGYMYDRVSGQLFSNSGTGNFILGPDKNT